jgi:glycerophosphoryl diester phosphodiesterase
MELPAGIEKALVQCIDFIFMLLPRQMPEPHKLKACKIVSHRGEHDNITVCENTIAAFDRALELRIWGIEFDVRWTRDLQPVVAHDPDLERVFGMDTTIAEVEFDELRSQCPENAIFQDCFSSLQPGKDYHLMTLTPEMFDLITFAPPSTFIPIALLNMPNFSKLALEKNYRGVAGHYLLLTHAILKKHHQKGQLVGTGYPSSKNCLFREVNRGVEWIFSNNAGELMAIINRLT